MREVFASWQGIPGMAMPGAVQFTRSQGLSGDFGFITVPMRNFDGFRVQPAAPEFFPRLIGSDNGLGNTTERARLATAPPPAAAIPDGAELDIVGALVLDDGRSSFTVPDVYMREDGIEEMVPGGEGGDGPIVRIPLTDVRYWWSRRGCVPAHACNVPDGRGGFLPYSYDPDTGAPWLLGKRLRWLQAYLPGSPALGHLAPELRGIPFVGGEYSGAELAVDLIAELADRYGLIRTLDVDPPGTMSYWRPGQGAVGYGQGNGRGIDDQPIAQHLRSKSFSFPPIAVKVVGGPTVREHLALRFEAAGKLADGKIVRLEAALADIGLTLEEGGELALQQRAHIVQALGEQQAARFSEWAFKLYRLHEEDRATMLPILDRVKTDAEGKRLPPAVYATAWGEVDPPELPPEPISADDGTVTSGPGEPQPRTKFLGKPPPKGITGVFLAQLDKLSAAEKVSGLIGFALGGPAGFAIAVGVTGLTENALGGDTSKLRRFGGRRTKPPRGFDGPAERKQRFRDRLLAEREQIFAKIDAGTVTDADVDRLHETQRLLQDQFSPIGVTGPRFVNLPISEVTDGGYRIDRAAGTIRFTQPRGTLRYLAVDHIEQDQLVPADVWMWFAAEDKPNTQAAAQQPGEIGAHRFRYQAVWANGVAREVSSIDASAIGCEALEQPRLVRQIGLDGEDNIEDLREQARRIARSKLGVPSASNGGRSILPVFLPANCNGRVKSVTWATGGDVPLTEINAASGRRDAHVTTAELTRIFGGVAGRKPVGFAAAGPATKAQQEAIRQVAHARMQAGGHRFYSDQNRRA